MLDRFERPLRILALALAAVLVFQFVRLVLRGDPLAHLRIPNLPTLAAATNSVHGTNMAKATNINKGTVATNLSVSANAVPGAPMANPTNGTTAANSIAAQTNAVPGARRGPPPSGRAKGMAGMMPGGMPHADLPPAIQSRVDKIIDSEILGPVMRPQPMALIGIADDEAFIRAPDGQTGPVKVGHELGGIKLLLIGINRVLIEQDGEKKELTLFGGLGGKSLMPKTNDVPTNSPSQTNQTLASTPKETH